MDKCLRTDTIPVAGLMLFIVASLLSAQTGQAFYSLGGVVSSVAGLFAEKPPDLDPQAFTFGRSLTGDMDSLGSGKVRFLRKGSALFTRPSYSKERQAVALPMLASLQSFPSATQPEATLTQGSTTVDIAASLDAGGDRLLLDLPRSFSPGLYKLRTQYVDAAGARRDITQDFAWGVLAMNPDADRYRPGETASIAFGVLDERGRVVCNAQMILTVRAPDGSTQVLSTENGRITVSDTCRLYQAGLIEPDYKTSLLLAQSGVYAYDLLAITGNGVWTIADSTPVSADPPLVVRRTAATRLWPKAPSVMSIRVRTKENFRGVFTEIVPREFVISRTEPEATVEERSDTRIIAWKAEWRAGETVRFDYVYDAPDVSPDFFLLGPSALSGVSAPVGIAQLTESRSWQIANDLTGACCIYGSCNDDYDDYDCAMSGGTFYQDLYCNSVEVNYCYGASSSDESSSDVSSSDASSSDASSSDASSSAASGSSTAWRFFFFLDENDAPSRPVRSYLILSGPVQGGSRGFL